MPELETLEIMKLVNCPETFTPDMRCIMGESPLVQGYFVLAGMNSAGLSFGGGAGRDMERWLDGKKELGRKSGQQFPRCMYTQNISGHMVTSVCVSYAAGGKSGIPVALRLSMASKG
ncbi:hypothetical protein MC885_002792 [Smutsia gigantea]|nr:hypothetical protein MC885_002792 [Smutsia gigantea]